MKGQWIGTYTGATTGNIIVNVDELTPCFQGVAYLNEDNKAIPSVAAFFRTTNKNSEFEFRTSTILPLNPYTGSTDSWDNVKHLFDPNAFVSSFVDVKGSWAGNKLSMFWTSDREVSGNCILARSKADQPSLLVPLRKGWDNYKSHVAGLEGRRYLFRGQNKPWRLRTSYHRAGRADIIRFINEDIQTLHRHLSARTKHVFNLEIANENGAFFNLVQHHGYPTPLLDWTYSPYVAAFFAYRGISKEQAANASPSDKVRIHIFDQSQWKTDFNQLVTLASAGLHLSVSEFMAIENERMIPQQAASTITNIDDIESYIKYKESKGKKYLSAIDLPVRDRDKIVQELSYMGITAGSMFPGLDGACEELKERNFEI